MKPVSHAPTKPRFDMTLWKAPASRERTSGRFTLRRILTAGPRSPKAAPKTVLPQHTTCSEAVAGAYTGSCAPVDRLLIRCCALLIFVDLQNRAGMSHWGHKIREGCIERRQGMPGKIEKPYANRCCDFLKMMELTRPAGCSEPPSAPRLACQ
jgi:hypothetical protein